MKKICFVLSVVVLFGIFSVAYGCARTKDVPVSRCFELQQVAEYAMKARQSGKMLSDLIGRDSICKEDIVKKLIIVDAYSHPSFAGLGDMAKQQVDDYKNDVFRDCMRGLLKGI